MSALLTLAALVVAAAFARREFFPPSVPRSPVGGIEAAEFLVNWESLLSAGVRLGAASAPVKVIEFSDLECPFCRRFHASLQSARRAYAGSVEYVFVHYPLPMHRFARPAARAAECANDQARFGPFVDAVFAQQDSLGFRSSWDFAREAGVSDSARFANCLVAPATDARIAASLEVGQEWGVNATPTVLVNGWRLPGTPTEEELGRVIADLLAGRSPFPVDVAPSSLSVR